LPLHTGQSFLLYFASIGVDKRADFIIPPARHKAAVGLYLSCGILNTKIVNNRKIIDFNLLSF